MQSMGFKDHFSGHAGAYARFRPRYPARLFELLAEAAPGRRLAWDCAAGNGQAAEGLQSHFEHVVATDASATQVAGAPCRAGLGLAVALAEAAPLATGAVDAVTVAQALHWLDAPRFFAEVRRVLRPRGIVAAWTYAGCRVAPEVDAVVARLYGEIVGPYWPPERERVERGYAGLPFPFDPLPLPAVEMAEEWTADAMLGYLGTWSAVARYRSANGADPLDRIDADLRVRWGEGTRTVRWPLTLLAGRA